MRKEGTAIPHKNYDHSIKHHPLALRVYQQTPVRPCKWCGASPDNLVVYDMPLKNGKRAKVTRCTVCDNLTKFGAVRERARYSGR